MSKIMISESELKLILERHRENITAKRNWLDNIGTAGSLFLTIVSSDFKDLFFIKAQYIQYTVWIITIYFFCKGIWSLIQNIKNKFDKEVLFKEIQEKSEIEQVPYSIIIIKDDFNDYPNKFLVYEDRRWGCKLFLNYFMQNDNGQSEKNAQLESVSNYLKVDKNKMTIDYLFMKTSTKHSPTAHKDKTYNFYYYYLKIDRNSFSNVMKQESFEIDGRKYWWRSMDELMNDRLTLERNEDVLRVVKNDTGLA